jgi:general secretion pathway protein G
MVVIVIIGMLASVVTFSVRSYLISSKQNVAKMEISKMITALDTYYTQFGNYPKSSQGIRALATPNDAFPDAILTGVPVDPWGEPYDYICPAKAKPYEIICYGADGREGGSGADKDISSVSIQERRRSSTEE